MSSSPNVFATRGHSAAAPGLRGHSCGQHYPLTVIGYGNGWRVLNCVTGRESNTFRTYNEAEIALNAVRVRDLINC